MTRVRIIRDYDYPDVFRQLPHGGNTWADITFTEDPINTCDYLVILNRPPHDTTVICPPKNVWQIVQEPPVKMTRSRRKPHPFYAQIFSPERKPDDKRFIASQPALPWHVNRTYDELIDIAPPEKRKHLSWITSNKQHLVGHRQRMDFLEQLQSQVDFDLWGKGFTSIDDKWDGIAPYRYSLAIENYSGPDYWSEKLADCFLAWSMPIYYGCTNIDSYFPPESMVHIDINQPEEAIAIIQETIHSNLYLTRREAIAEARNRILNQYQLFPFIADKINALNMPAKRPRRIQISDKPSPSLRSRILNRINRLFRN